MSKESLAPILDQFYRIVDRSSPEEIDCGDVSILFQLIYQHFFHEDTCIPREGDLVDMAVRIFEGLGHPFGEKGKSWVDGPLSDPSYRSRLIEILSDFCSLYPLGFPISVVAETISPSSPELSGKFIYLFAFDASPVTSVDTLQYLHWELRQLSPDISLEGGILGAHANWIGLNGDIDRALLVDGRGIPTDFVFEEPIKPDIAHIGHLSCETERDVHRELFELFESSEVRMVNPYSSGVEICESKFRTSSVLKSAGIKVPRCTLISKFSERSEGALTERIGSFLKACGKRRIFVQPDRGTEGVGCRMFEALDDDVTREIVSYVLSMDDDVIVRAGIGNVEYRDEEDTFFPVFRINASFDGEGWHAESGFALIGHGVVSGSSNCGKIDINQAFRSLYFRGKPLDVGDGEIGQFREMVCGAVEAIFRGSEPPLILGVDFVLEVMDGGIEAFILDVNPRCVIPGSYRIGPVRSELGLGRSFWSGVLGR